MSAAMAYAVRRPSYCVTPWAPPQVGLVHGRRHRHPARRERLRHAVRGARRAPPPAEYTQIRAEGQRGGRGAGRPRLARGCSAGGGAAAPATTRPRRAPRGRPRCATSTVACPPRGRPRCAASAAAPPRRHRRHRRHRHHSRARRVAAAPCACRRPRARGRSESQRARPGRDARRSKWKAARPSKTRRLVRPAQAATLKARPSHSRPTCRRPRRGAGRPGPAGARGPWVPIAAA